MQRVVRTDNDAMREQMEDQNAKQEVYVLAAHMSTGDVKSNKPAAAENADKEKTEKEKADNEKNEKAEKSKAGKSSAAEEAAKQRAAHATNAVNVVLVSDIDVLSAQVFELRSHGSEEGDEEDFGIHFDNVVFVLNVLDELAGDPRFVENCSRNARPVHRTLTAIENRIEDYKQQLDLQRQDFEKEFDKEMKKVGAEGTDAEAELSAAQAKLAKFERDGTEPPDDLKMEFLNARFNKEIVDQRIKNTEEQLRRKHDRQVEVFDRQLNSELRARQNDYKLGALLLPPILPAIVAVFVFFSRRAQEREGVAKSRLR